MGQQQYRQLQPANKHHQFNSAAPMRKFLICSLGILLPFLILFCMFPSGASLYKPSYNRIVVSQLQVPASHLQSDLHESELFSPDKTPSTSNADNDGDDDGEDDNDDDDNDEDESAKGKQTDAATPGEASTAGNADSPPNAAKKQSNPNEMKTPPSIVEDIQSSKSEAKKENDGAQKESLSIDEGNHLSLKSEKGSNEDKEKEQRDKGEGNDLSTKAKKQTVEDEGDQSPTSNGEKQNDENESKASSMGEKLDSSKKEKKQNDGDAGDHKSSLKSTKKQNDGDEPEALSSDDDGLDLPSKKKKEQNRLKAKKKNDEDEAISNAAELDPSSKKDKKQEVGDEGDHLSTWKTKKQNEVQLIVSLKKPKKKQNDGDEDDQWSTKKQYAGDETEASVADDIDLGQKKAKQKKSKDGEKPENNADMIEQELDESNAETQVKKKKKKKINGDFNGDKENTIFDTELDEELSLSGKVKADEQNTDEPTADIQMKKKSTKKGKKMDKQDEISEAEDGEEDSRSGKRRKEQSDEGLYTGKTSTLRRKADVFANDEEDTISLSGKKYLSSSDEDSTSSHSTQLIRKPKGFQKRKDELEEDAEQEVSFSGKTNSSNKKKKQKKVEQEEEEDSSLDEDVFTQNGKLGDDNTKLGKPSSKKKKNVEEDSTLDDYGFTKKGKNNNENESNTKLGKTSSSKKKKKNMEEDTLDDDDDFTKKGKNTDEYEADTKLGHTKSGKVDGHASKLLFLKKADEDAFLSESTNANKKKKKKIASRSPSEDMEDTDLIDSQAEEGSTSKSFSSSLDDETNSVGETDQEAFISRPTMKNKKKNQISGLKKFNNEDAEEKQGQQLDEANDAQPSPVTSKSMASKKSKKSSLSGDDTTADLDSTRTSKKKNRSNEDFDDKIQQKSSNDDDSNYDSSLIISKVVPPKKSILSGSCKYFKGRWIMDSNYPPYIDSTCPWKSIKDEQNCKTTKKMTYWRWKPSECNMDRFKARAFLKLMKGKSIGFVGDKMVKAQMKSLVCLLAQVETPSLVYNDKINQSMSWHFSSSDLTLSLVLSPYLVQQTSEDRYVTLQLDKLDTKWAKMVPTLDVLIIGVGVQFAHPTLYMVRDAVVGCYSCQSLSTYLDITNLKEISLYSGFRAAMRSSIMGIGALPGFRGTILFLQPFGFKGNGSFYSVSSKMKDIQMQELKKARNRGVIYNQSRLEVLHTNLDSMGKYDPIKALNPPICLVPSPLADVWNQVLQQTLTSISTLESDT